MPGQQVRCSPFVEGLCNAEGIAMKHVSGAAFRIVLFVLIVLVCWWASVVRLSSRVNLMLMVGGLLLVFPFVWFGRKLLDQNPTPSRVAWVTTLVHYGMLLLLGV